MLISCHVLGDRVEGGCIKSDAGDGAARARNCAGGEGGTALCAGVRGRRSRVQRRAAHGLLARVLLLLLRPSHVLVKRLGGRMSGAPAPGRGESGSGAGEATELRSSKAAAGKEKRVRRAARNFLGISGYDGNENLVTWAMGLTQCAMCIISPEKRDPSTTS